MANFKTATVGARTQKTFSVLKENNCQDLPVVQWLRPRAPLQGTWVQSLVEELRACMSHGKKKKSYKPTTLTLSEKAVQMLSDNKN